MAHTRSTIATLAQAALAGFANTATLTTACAGTNNDLVYSAKNRGTGGNSITVAYVVAGNNTPLTVSVSTNAITVNVATNGGGTATSTAAQVKAAIEASTPAAALVSVANNTGNDGTGVVAAFTAAALAGGTDYVVGRGSSAVKTVAQRPY